MILRDGVNKEEHTRFMLKCLENKNSKALVGPCSIDYCCYVFLQRALNQSLLIMAHCQQNTLTG